MTTWYFRPTVVPSVLCWLNTRSCSKCLCFASQRWTLTISTMTTFTSELVDILCRLNADHIRFIVIENGVKLLYVRLIKAIYGCVKSALLWYKMFSSTVQKLVFVLNPYDPCIVKCMIQDKQCIIAWYVDNNKISHEDPGVVTMIINKIEAQFGKMTVTRGRKHVFLGMDVKYTDKRTSVISMKRYLQEAIDKCG